jgi:hypothetical protein
MEEIHTVLTSLGIIDCFDALTSGKEVPRSKPDPAIYLLACSRLGVEPREAVALEDSGPGVAAARAAGLRCLAIPSEITMRARPLARQRQPPSLVGVTPVIWRRCRGEIGPRRPRSHRDAARMILAALDLDPLLTAILAERRDLVAAWLRGEPGSWGALAAQAILATRRALGRSLTDTERRIVWQARVGPPDGSPAR